MPSARQRKRRTETRAQQRAQQGQAAHGCQSDQAWLDGQQTEIQRLATDLQNRRDRLAQAQQLLNERNAQQETQTQSGGAYMRNTTTVNRAPASSKRRAKGSPRKDGTQAGQNRKASPRPRRTRTPRQQVIGKSQQAGDRARQTRNDTRANPIHYRDTQHIDRPGSGHTHYEYLQPGQQHIAPTKLYTKAYNELMQTLELDQPPMEPTARKLFDAQILTKVKRIMKSQKERERRRAKAKTYRQNLFNKQY